MVEARSNPLGKNTMFEVFSFMGYRHKMMQCLLLLSHKYRDIVQNRDPNLN